jgi:hypothetical protein
VDKVRRCPRRDGKKTVARKKRFIFRPQIKSEARDSLCQHRRRRCHAGRLHQLNTSPVPAKDFPKMIVVVYPMDASWAGMKDTLRSGPWDVFVNRKKY